MILGYLVVEAEALGAGTGQAHGDPPFLAGEFRRQGRPHRLLIQLPGHFQPLHFPTSARRASTRCFAASSPAFS